MRERDRHFIAERLAPAPHLAHPERCAALSVEGAGDGVQAATAGLRNHPGNVGVLRSYETPAPLGSPQVPRHRAPVGSYEGGVSYERGTPVADTDQQVVNEQVALSAGGRCDGAHSETESCTVRYSSQKCEVVPTRVRVQGS